MPPISAPVTIQITCAPGGTFPAFAHVNYIVGDTAPTLNPNFTSNPPECASFVSVVLEQVTVVTNPPGVSLVSPGIYSYYTEDPTVQGTIYKMVWKAIDPSGVLIANKPFDLKPIKPSAWIMITGPLVINYDIGLGTVLSTPVPFTVSPAFCQPHLTNYIWTLANPPLTGLATATTAATIDVSTTDLLKIGTHTSNIKVQASDGDCKY